MTTQEVANRFNELAQSNNWEAILTELYSADAESIEPEGAVGLTSVKGMPAIVEKAKQFNESIEEIHGGWCSEPVVGGSYFSVSMGMDVTFKGMGRINMAEICLYHVVDGKIVSEQFFYDTNSEQKV